MTVEGDVDAREPLAQPVDEHGHSVHVAFRAFHVERPVRVTKVILRIDDEQVNLWSFGERHGVSLGSEIALKGAYDLIMVLETFLSRPRRAFAERS